MFFFFFLKIYLLCIQCSVCLYACWPEEGTRSHYRWLWATMWPLGTELWTSRRAIRAPNLWDISPAPARQLLKAGYAIFSPLFLHTNFTRPVHVSSNKFLSWFVVCFVFPSHSYQVISLGLKACSTIIKGTHCPVTMATSVATGIKGVYHHGYWD